MFRLRFVIKPTLTVGFFLILTLFNCSSLLVRYDYNESRTAWENSNPKEALDRFPDGESGKFITILEKAHIGFFKDKYDYSDLTELAETSKERLRFSASRELKSFFYLETGEGYYASEAEIIYMHILLGLFFAKDNQVEKAEIEARYAGNLLSGEWSAEGQFDDASLRVLLATLWMACGNWEEARVDLKRAHSLSPKSKDLAILSSLAKAPNGLTIVFGGPGAEPVINMKANLNFIRGLRNLEFSYTGKKSELVWTEINNSKGRISPELYTSSWNVRHLTRDNAIHELIEDSKYFQLMSASALKEGAKGGAKITGIVIVTSVIVAAGGGITYAGVYGNSSDVAAIGLIIMYAGVVKGYEWTKETINQAARNYSKDTDISNEYRFVRFLPEYLWITSSHTKRLEQKDDSRPSIQMLKPFGKIPVQIGFFPDSGR